MIAKKIFLGLTVLFCNLGVASPFPKQAVVPGGIVKLNLGRQPQAPVAHFQGQRVMIIKNKNQWQAIVGIPLDTQPGSLSIEFVNAAQNKHQLNFTVKQKRYREQHLKIKKKRHVTPSNKDLLRIKKEKKKILKLLAKWNEQSFLAGGFLLPVKGRLSSPFGLRRFFNGEPRSPHKGIDIAAPEGTLMRSPAAGIVLGTGNYFFNGNTVLVDHGQGLVTMYCHMQKFKVKPGQKLKQGGIIGTVGKTGRATGPHVHWAVFLNQTAVDPTLFLPKDVFMPKKRAK